ncbi:magnesium transporter [Elusimicrobiota bacterium]
MPIKVPLLKIAKHAFERDPLTAAQDIEALHENEAMDILKAMPCAITSKVFPFFQPSHAARLLQNLPEEIYTGIIKAITPEQAVAILTQLPKNAQAAMVANLPDATKKELQDLLVYPENSVGRIMRTDFLAFHSSASVKDVVQRIRTMAHKGTFSSYAYVVDSENHLIGVLNMLNLILAPASAALETVMRKNIFTVNGFTDREDAAHEITDRKYFALPVTDSENRLVGVVRSEQLLTPAQEEASEDLLKMFGAGGNERPFSPVGFSMRKRLPWLYINLATAFLAASVVALFEDLIAKVVILAVFLPVVAGQGGNSGAQSLAVVMRGLVMREIPKQRVMQFLRKEALIGIANGALIGVVTAAIAWAWHGNPYLGLVIGMAMLVSLACASVAGAAIPILMKKMGFDPAQSSNIILTTITDVVGFFSFLGFAMIFQRFLM